jgi:hypothetical protein
VVKYLLTRARLTRSQEVLQKLLARPRLIWGAFRRMVRADGNAKELDNVFLSNGCSLVRMDCVGDGVPDRIVGGYGHNVLAEYKRDRPTSGTYDRGGSHGIQPNQEAFAQLWRGGTVFKVKTREDAERVVRYLREQSRP